MIYFTMEDHLMPTHAVIWIDHKEARIFHVQPETVGHVQPEAINRRQSTKQRSYLRNTLSIDIPRGGERQKSTPMTPRGSSTRSRDCSTVRMPFSSLVRRQRSSNSSGSCKTTTRSSKQELLGLRPWIIRPTEKSLRTPRSTSYGAIGCDLRYQVPTRRLRRSPSGTA